jgi:membrane-bound lytic murein transglycosylase B
MWARLFVLIFSLFVFYHSANAIEKNTDTPIPFVDRPEVKTFIKQMVKKHHFKKNDLIALFNSVKVRPKVVKKVKSPLELKPWYTYQMLFVTEWRIRKGLEFWDTYKDALTATQKKYGVPASIIVATIGVETKYGLHTGEYPVIDALTNIGFSDSPRAPFFKKELEEFLLLVREEHLDPHELRGSYAGAIGQPQFMPSSYRRYAVSYSGHSKIDLSHNEEDVIASIGNYYQKHGWKTDQPVAIPVSILGPNKFPSFFNKHYRTKIKGTSRLLEYGIKPGTTLDKQEKFKIITLQGYLGSEYWLGFNNFDVIKRYNPSDLYAMAVFQLSHYILTLREKLDA